MTKIFSHIMAVSLKELTKNAASDQITKYLKIVENATINSAKQGNTYIEIWTQANDVIAGDESITVAVDIPPIYGGSGKAGKFTLANKYQYQGFRQQLIDKYRDHPEVTVYRKTEDGFRRKIEDPRKDKYPHGIIELRW